MTAPDFILTLDHLNDHGKACVTRFYESRYKEDGTMKPYDNLTIDGLEWEVRLDTPAVIKAREKTRRRLFR